MAVGKSMYFTPAQLEVLIAMCKADGSEEALKIAAKADRLLQSLPKEEAR